VDLLNIECSTNLILDTLVSREAAKANVEKKVLASSGCAYPNHIQQDPAQELYLTEDMVGPPYDSDGKAGRSS